MDKVKDYLPSADFFIKLAKLRTDNKISSTSAKVVLKHEVNRLMCLKAWQAMDISQQESLLIALLTDA